MSRRTGPRTRLVRVIIAPTAAIFGVARGGALVNYVWVLSLGGFVSTPTPSPGAAQGMGTFPLSALDPRVPARIAAGVRHATRDPSAAFDGLNLSRRPITNVLYWSAAVRSRGRTHVFQAAPNGTRLRRIA